MIIQASGRSGNCMVPDATFMNRFREVNATPIQKRVGNPTKYPIPPMIGPVHVSSENASVMMTPIMLS
jgi:hypothetical protein